MSAVDKRETRQDKTRDDACPSLITNVKVPDRVLTHIKGKGTLTTSSLVTLSLIGTLGSSLVWPCHAMPAPSVYPYDWGYLRSLLQILRYASNCLAGLAGEGGPANFCGNRCLTCTPQHATMGQKATYTLCHHRRFILLLLEATPHKKSPPRACPLITSNL